MNPAAKFMAHDEIESTSNVATPLVRPVRDTVAEDAKEAMNTPLVENDVLLLSEPAATSITDVDPAHIPGSSPASNYTSSSLEGYDFYGMESFTPAMDFTAPPKKAPLRLDYSENREVSTRMQPKRHDSGESFAMFSTSGDSQSRFMSSSAGSDPEKGQPSSLRERVSDWENSMSNRSNQRPTLDHRTSMDSNAQTVSTDSSDGTSYLNSFQEHRTLQNGGQPKPRPPTFRIQEASFRAATDVVPTGASEDEISPWSVETSKDPGIIESDFLPWSTDPDFVITPIDPKILVQRSITFEAQTGALNASAMVLLLRPYLPDGAIDDLQARAILAQYHQRLTSMRLFTEAALLRNLCVPLYPNVFAMAQEEVTTGFFCTDCHKPLENDPTIANSQWRCPRCQHAISGCAVCLQREVDVPISDEEAVDNVLWWMCSGCGHGGHTMCMRAWHAVAAGSEGVEGDKYSGGCCPLEGCLHPCLPGTWREIRAAEVKAAKQVELDMLVRENARQGSAGRGVRRDAREVNQSKAVEGVRVALGLAGGGLERKKSVKVIAPGEQAFGVEG